MDIADQLILAITRPLPVRVDENGRKIYGPLLPKTKPAREEDIAHVIGPQIAALFSDGETI